MFKHIYFFFTFLAADAFLVVLLLSFFFGLLIFNYFFFFASVSSKISIHAELLGSYLIGPTGTFIFLFLALFGTFWAVWDIRTESMASTSVGIVATFKDSQLEYNGSAQSDLLSKISMNSLLC